MKVIGIDLGTTNSCVYVLDEEGQPQLVLTSGKYKIFPSVVWSAGPGKDVVVGHAAKVRIGQQPAPVIAVKRKMGTTETVLLGGQAVLPREVSAHILRHVKRQIEELTHDQIGGVIVTVPAYFEAAPKNDTYRAAVDAFFDGDADKAQERIQLQLEPEAAAYAYAAEAAADHLRILVYDLGGGTFDVTVLEKSRDAGLAVLKFGGDPHLGGDNVDDRIASWFLFLLRGGRPHALNRLLDERRYPAEIRYTLLQQVLANDVEPLRAHLRPDDRDLLIPSNPPVALDLDYSKPDDLRRIQVLKRLAEVAKIELTTAPEAVVAKQGAFEDQNGEVVDIDLMLTRSDFDQLIGDFIETTIAAVDKVLDESGQTPATIDRVLLVGGSSRMPGVRQALEQRFTCPILLADPDLIVARGAAIRARSLNPPPLDAAGGGQLRLTYPHETFEESITVRGELREPPSGRAYLLQDHREVADAPLVGGVFVLKDVPLQLNQQNRFKVEVVDERENPVLEQEFVVRHDEHASGGTDRLAPKITQAIRALSTQGYVTLFKEGDTLPVTMPFVCHRATQDDHIDIEFYEGTRELAKLHMQVDPKLPIGAAIDLEITVSDTYQVSASAVIRETKQAANITFEIEHVKIPPLRVMDEDLRQVLDQINNDLERVRDVNDRVAFASRCQRLAADYAKARSAIEKDGHKLFSAIGELRTLLVEIRAAQVTLEPPIEDFEKLVQACRGLAGEVEPAGVATREDILERINSLERAGRDAWKQEDAAEWKHVTAEIRKLLDQLRRAAEEARSGGGTREPISPSQLRAGILDWLADIRDQAKEHHLEGQFGNEIGGIERAVRAVELHDENRAREALGDILDRQVRPLAHRVELAIEGAGGQMRAHMAKVTFHRER